ncbi:MAG TPA: hypothetical protein VLO13_00905 [Halomonas sp.]|nr:hypothetical protein [Halomonas sp.]
MNIFFKALAMMSFVLQATTVNAAEQLKSVTVERSATGVNNEPLFQGGVTIQGSTQVFRPLPPEEVEKLGREGAKRRMMQQKR